MPVAKIPLDPIIANVRMATLAMEDRAQVNLDSLNPIIKLWFPVFTKS